MSLGRKVRVAELLPASLRELMYLETTNSSDEEDVLGSRLRTPPGSSQSIPGAPALQPIRRELLADVSCAKALIERFGADSEPFGIVTVDLLGHFSAGTMSALNSATAIVMAPTLANGMSAVEAIDQLRGAVPHVGLYVVARETSEIARTLPKLAAAGVDEVFCFAVKSDVDAFEDTLRARLSAPAPETEIRLLWKWFRESPERSLVMHCVRNGYRLDIWHIRSEVFSACRKTLQNRMSVLGLPSPGILSRCGRVLHAQELERRGMKPTTAIASLLGFPSAGAMQRARRRLRKALMSRGRQALVFASLLK
jgi:hypothetical protein